MKKNYLWLLVLFTMWQVQSQVSTYTFSQSVGTYVEITGGTQVISCLDCGTVFDTNSYAITLPTPFYFNGENITNVVMRVDGNLVVGTSALSSSSGPIAATTVASGVISALGMDLRNCTTTGVNWEMRWEEVGSEYVFQWKNAARWAQNAEQLNFQIRINKTSGLINVVFGTMLNVANSTTYQPQVGLRGVTNTDYNNRRLTTTIPDTTPSWDDTVTGTSNSHNLRFTSGAPAAFPATGLTYTWTAPTATADWVNLQSPATHTMPHGATVDIFGRMFKAGVTDVDPAQEGTGISYSIGLHTTNTDPATWPSTAWKTATYVGKADNGSGQMHHNEYKIVAGSGINYGTYYYATRVRYNGGPIVYGGYNTGTWNGTTNINGTLIIEPYCNVSNTPSITTSVGGSTCGAGNVSLTATASSGTLAWFANPTGGTKLADGSPYNVNITATTNYYVEAQEISAPMSGGARVSTTATSGTTPNTYGLVFDANYDFKLNSVEIKLSSTTAGNVVMMLQNSAGVTMQEATIAVPAGNATTPVVHTLNLNFDVPVGTGYRLLAISGPAMVRESSLGGFPYAIGVAGNVTSGYLGGTSNNYYYFYNWNYSVKCTSPRTMVTATYNNPPAITLSSNTVSICNGLSSAPITLTAGGTNYQNFNWTPAAGVTGDATNGWVFNPTTTTTYTLNATQTPAGCINSAQVVVTVNPLPTDITITPTSPVSVCNNVIQALTATGGNETVIVLNEDFNAATNNWITINNSTGGTPTDAAWTLRPDGYVYTNSTQLPVFRSNDSTQFYMSNSDDQGSGGTTETILESPSFSLVGASAASLNFWHYYRDYNAADFARVQVSTNGGVDWVNLQEYTTTQGSLPTTTGAQTVFANANLDLSAYIGETNVKVRFKYNGAWSYYWVIDNVKVTTTKQASLTWSPATNLFTDAAATTAYTGENLGTVYFKSSNVNNTAYTATATSSVGCSITQTANVVVSAIPTVVTVPPTATCAPISVDLTDSSITTGSDAGLTFSYWTNATATTAVSNPTAVGAGTYYIKGTNANGCSAIQSITITENNCSIGWANLQWPGTSTKYTCETETYYAQVWKADVTPGAGQGAGITAWIGVSTSNTDPSTWAEANWHLATYNGLSSNPDNDEYMYTVSGLSAGTYYVASRFKHTTGAYYYGAFNSSGGGAWNGTTNVNATLTINNVAAPTGNATQSVTVTTPAEATLEDLVVTGSNITWYASAANASAGISPLPNTTQLVNGTTYYATQTINGCVSISSLAVTVTVTLGNDNFNTIRVKYYPNPVTDVLNISALTTITNVKVINLIGQVVLFNTLNVAEAQIDLSALPNTTYIIKVVAENNAVSTFKVVKK